MQNQLKKKILEKADLKEIKPNLNSLKIIPEDIAEKTQLIAFDNDKKTILLLTTNNYPQLVMQVSEKLSMKGYKLDYYYIDDESFDKAISRYKLLKDKEDKEQQEKLEKQQVVGDQAVQMIKDLYENKSNYEEGEFIEELIRLAYKAGSSDLHFQSEEMGVVMRIRRDGIMKTVLIFSHNEFKKYHIKLKFMSKVKVNIDTIPQDGRFDFDANIGEKKLKIDVRVNFMPGLRLENIVMRFLDSSKGILTFDQIGFFGHNYEIMKKNLEQNFGMIIMTGPTGSGKTTTLYSMLNYLNLPNKKIITLEDPVEFELPGLQQSQIDAKKGYNYEDGLKSILRQDPDVIMVGEIRSLETAEIAINAALTGHLVISTLHTNTAIEAISRLVNMGVKPYLLASALNLIIGQRLLRRLCDCHRNKQPSMPQDQEIKSIIKKMKDINPRLKLNYDGKIPNPVGCEKCSGEGYSSRLAVLECFEMIDQVQEAVLNEKNILEVYGAARSGGFMTMKEDAYIKMFDGLTTLDEIRRVL